MAAVAVLFVAGMAVAVQAQQNQDPYGMPDDSWVSLSGTVVEASLGSFVLDYGSGTIGVETDWGAAIEGYELSEGDRVTVYGEIDDDFFTATEIEAESVFVEGSQSYYGDRPDDDFAHFRDRIDEGYVVLQGTVTEVDESEFTLDTGDRRIEVETSEMDNDPLEDDEQARVFVGDRVSVRGELEMDFFEGRELEAESVVTLRSATDHRTTSRSNGSR